MDMLFGGEKKTSYPALILRKAVLFPGEKLSLVLEGEEASRAVESALKGKKELVFLVQKDGGKSKIAILASLVQHWDLAPSITGVSVEGLRRVRVAEEFSEDKLRLAEVFEIEESARSEEKKTELEALSRSLLEQFKKIMQAEGVAPFMVADELQGDYIHPEKASDLIAAALKLDFPDKLLLLETLDVGKRLEILNKKLSQELSIAKTEARIQQEMERELSQTQKEILLRERLKVIEKELGISEGQKEFEDLEKKILEARLPFESEKKVINELHRLKQMPAMNPEGSYLRTYLEWVADLPWSKRSEAVVDLKKARQVLDEDHYGLEKAKERVLEYLAVQKLTGGKGRGGILCFVGPPGTGKTSVGQSIARALDRKFVRVSLGGIRDEAEIRGHRRTYVGALPGRIIQGMRTAGMKNPVFMMDEVDKIGADFRGDPAAALLEVLDPAQNNSFSDHYIEIPYDLSEVFFITTANILDPIPPALRDRMEVIEFPGYTDEEKFHIARKFLLPRVLRETGLGEKQLFLSDTAIHRIVNFYTREAGVRELERKLSEIARKIARQAAEGRLKKRIRVGEKNLADYLGPEGFEIPAQAEKDEVGAATALAWTPAGGETISIEASLVPGKGNLTLTGQLGEVMQESARAALTYVRSRSGILGFPDSFYYKSDIHVHVPEGAIPKDGPSAGIAIAAALASRVTGRPVRKNVALSGEVTLAGKVLRVGGIKEKVLAAQRGGAKMIVLPAGNEKNLTDVPEEVRKEMKFKFVKHMDEVLNLALK